MNVITNPIVLVLNRHWQAINVRTPADAFCQLATGVATALDVDGDNLRPVTWDEWLHLPVRPHDQSAQTVRGAIRIPTVIIALNYTRVPKRRPRLNARNIRARDRNRCQYTGRELAPGEGNIDHVIPRSRGGVDSWENCVWACKEINSRKGDRLPGEAGLTLLRQPSPPRELPATAFIRNAHGIPDWNLFLS